jgi:hypothetical protein
MSAPTVRRRWPLVAAVVIGIGLALAPVAFQMFTRAPHGGTMIKGFKPYMNVSTIDGFRKDLAVIDAAQRQSTALVDRSNSSGRYPEVVTFDTQWPAINADMGSMLTTMRANIGHYRGVAALPPFVLFPWFFVIPGVLIAALAIGVLLVQRHGIDAVKRRRMLAALGLGLIAAPAVFQMFTRAPGGQTMIGEFKPFMTTAKVTEIQGYFLTIGSAEGQLRLKVLPSMNGSQSAAPVNDIKTLNRDWPTISATMAPMIGAMADNVGNFQGVAALPPFGLFPWFFVAPGVLVIALSLAGRRPARVTASLPVSTRVEGVAS